VEAGSAGYATLLGAGLYFSLVAYQGGAVCFGERRKPFDSYELLVVSVVCLLIISLGLMTPLVPNDGVISSKFISDPDLEAIVKSLRIRFSEVYRSGATGSGGSCSSTTSGTGYRKLVVSER
jgi:hypothetical protein